MRPAVGAFGRLGGVGMRGMFKLRSWRLSAAAASCLLMLSWSPPGSIGQEPRNPGAITSCPSWLKPGAPFDVEAFFARPAAGKDAAPLYFEAFAEFTAEADACLPERMRNPLGADRQGRIRTLREELEKPPQDRDRKAIDALVAELHDGYRKLAGAQRRPECAFAFGCTYDALLPHAQAARTAAMAVALRIARDAEKGNLERAIPDLALMLRLSRDVRPQGPMIVQLVSVSIDGNALLAALPEILRSPALKPRHCDRLLALLREHEAAGLDRFATGSKSDYVMQRAFLRACQEKQLMQAGPDGRPTDRLLSITDAARMIIKQAVETSRDGTPPLGDETIPVMEALLRGHGPAWPKERRALDDFARAMAAPGPIRYADRVGRFRELKEKYLGGHLPDSLFVAQLTIPPYNDTAAWAARGDLYNRAAQALVALRRGRLSGEPEAPSLAAACKGAGLPAVPVDPYCDAPLKMAVIGGEPVVYSIGPDGVDDQALVDAQLGRNPNGDILFRLPAPDAGRR